MSVYIDTPIETDPDTLAQLSFDYLQSVIPGWVPADGNLETWQIEAVAQIAAVVRDLASTVPLTIFRYFGVTMMGIQANDAAPALADTTWTAIDTAGYTIPSGTQVGIRDAFNQLIEFETINEVTIPNGSSATSAGEVQIRSIVAGAAGDGVGGNVELIDTLPWVTAVVTTADAAGGAEAEDDAAYLDRLSSELTLLSPVPILPGDFEVLAKTRPGVYRALVIDGYDPVGPTTGNERMVTVFGLHQDGTNLSGGEKTAVATYLDSLRETNFVVNTDDPTRHNIDVTFTVHKLAQYDSADVLARTEAAVTSYLDPASWGNPLVSENVDADRMWVNQTAVRYLELATLLNNVEGVDYVSALTFGLHGGALATTDVTMTGAAPLPVADVITGTVI